MIEITQAQAELVVAGAARAAIYGVPLVVGWRVMRQFTWPIGVACALGIVLGMSVMTGRTTLAAGIGVALAGVNAWIYVDRMRNDPVQMRRLLSAKEAAWSRERHDLVNEIAALRARLHLHDSK